MQVFKNFKVLEYCTENIGSELKSESSFSLYLLRQDFGELGK